MDSPDLSGIDLPLFQVPAICEELPDSNPQDTDDHRRAEITVSPDSAYYSSLSGRSLSPDTEMRLQVRVVPKGRGNKAVAVLEITSRAMADEDPLLYFPGDEVNGSLAFPHARSDLRSVQAIVTLQEFAPGHTVAIQESTARMHPGDINIASLEDGYVKWPFNLPLPTRGARSRTSPLSLAPSFGSDELAQRHCIICIEIFKDNIFRKKSSLGRLALPVDIISLSNVSLRSPTLASTLSLYPPSRQMTPRRSYTISDEPWKARSAPTINVHGTIFGRDKVLVVCDLSIPETYPAGHLVPLRLTLTSTSRPALDLLAAHHAVRTELKKVVQFGADAGAKIGPLRIAHSSAYHSTQHVGTTRWRVVNAAHELPFNGVARRWRVEMHGEMHPLDDHTFETGINMRGVSVMHHIIFYPFKAKNFTPEAPPDKELLIAKLSLHSPSQSPGALK